MDKMSIAFPNLGIYLPYVPKQIVIGSFTIALYGMIIAIGILCGFTLANKQASKLGMPKDIMWDFSVPAIVFSVLGARAYYVIFQWSYYKNHPSEIINIRNGGLAIYGGAIAGFLTLFIFTKIKKVSYFKMVDAAVFGLVLGQIIGRWGNFTNRECFGGYTEGLLAMRLPIEMVRGGDISPEIMEHVADGANYIQVHPTFLYESGLNLCLLIIMLLYSKHKKFNGEMALCYIGGYGIIRFFVEGLRTDQLIIGSTGIAVSQMLGMILFIASLILLITGHVLTKKGNFKLALSTIETENSEEKEQ